MILLIVFLGSFGGRGRPPPLGRGTILQTNKHNKNK